MIKLLKTRNKPALVAYTLTSMADKLTKIKEHHLAANVWGMLRDYSQKQIEDYEAKKVEMP